MNSRQRGVALLMVLLILALMMVLASAMTERSARMYQQTATTLAEARQLLQARAATGWSSVAAFLSQPLLQKTDTSAARPWLAVHSERFIATFSVVMGSARYQQRSLLQKQGRTFSVVQRRYGIYWVADE